MSRMQAGSLRSFTGTGWVRPRGDPWSGTGGASIPIFQGIADKVSYGMDTPVNIAVWISARRPNGQ
jgi:hypothetical protein